MTHLDLARVEERETETKDMRRYDLVIIDEARWNLSWFLVRMNMVGRRAQAFLNGKENFCDYA